MTEWKITNHAKMPALNNPILIEGLPGIGNVGKITVDFMIEELRPRKVMTFFSHSLPQTVFVNEQDLVELPDMSLYVLKRGKENKKGKGVQKDKAGEKGNSYDDLLFLAGDIQPLEENASYDFAERMLDICQQHGVKEIITLGGIGLEAIPKSPKIFAAANSKDILKRYGKYKIEKKLFGTVGPIIGLTGTIPALAKKRKIEAIILLAETYGHPNYIGVEGAEKVIGILNQRLGLNLNAERLGKEVKSIEEELIKRAEQLIKQQQGEKKRKGAQETSYIG